MRTRQLFCFLTAALALLLFSFASYGEGRPFITRWKGEAGKELRIPIDGGNYKLVIKKADGTVLKTEPSLTIGGEGNANAYKYTPIKDGEILVEAGPAGVTSFQMCNQYDIKLGSSEALLRVEQFGTVEWETMENAFSHSKNMQFAEGIDTPDLRKVTDMSGMFKDCSSFNQPLSNWDVSQVTDMSNMFYDCTAFNQPLNNWNVNQVTNMGGMFKGCSSFNQPLNNWDVSKVTYMGNWHDGSGMFSGCTSFNQPLNNWDVSKVTDMRGMFSGCSSFNQPLNNWDVSQVTDMGNMFRGCTTFNQPLNNWDVSKVTNMYAMFSGCTTFNQPLNNWDVSQVTDMGNMFRGCTAFNQELGMWKLRQCVKLGLDKCGMSVENYSKSLVGWAAQTYIKRGLCLDAAGLKYNPHAKAARKLLIDEKEWRIREEIDENGRPFITRWKGEAGKELKIPIYGDGYKLVIKKADGTVLKTESSLTIDEYKKGTVYKYTPTKDGELLVEAGPVGVSSINMDYDRNDSAEALLRVEQFGTVEWETMVYAFKGCKNMQFAEGIDIPDLSRVMDMSSMFSGCTSFNQPLNSWDVSQVTKMWSMFYGCTTFNQPLNNWDVSQVTDMGDMFLGCTTFNQPLNNWDVSKVTYMGWMFYGCTSFNQDLGMWKLERCHQLGLDNCGMSIENYSKSLMDWAAQANIKKDLVLTAQGLKYDASGKAARKQLKEGKRWHISGDTGENDHPFITRWKGEVGKVLRIPILGENYKLVIKKADGTVLKTEPSLTSKYEYEIWKQWFYSFIPTEDGELLVEAGPDGVTSFQMWDQNWKRQLGTSEALLRVEQFGTVEWETMKYAFYGCKNMQFAADIDTPDLSKVTDMEEMFSGCHSFNQSLYNWDVSQVTDMNNMFSGCTAFNQDLGKWKLEKCHYLGLDGCGMSVENYSKSLVGWAAQDDISEYLQLNAKDLKYFLEVASARNTLISSKHWRIEGDKQVTHYLYFEPSSLSLAKHDEYTLTLVKKGVEGEIVMLTSSDPSTVQIIDAASFKIKGLKLGKATLTARVASSTTHGELIAKCEVTVSVVRVTGVSLSQTELTLKKDAKATLVATVVPSDATNKNVLWYSDNAGIVTVENGVVTAVAEGQTTVRVFTEEGNFTTECKVTVGNNGGGNSVAVTGVKLSQNKLTLKKDDSFTLVATLEPSTASNKTVMWTTSNDAVVSVSDNGVIQAKAVGVAVITVTTQEGAFTATCEVTVTEEDVVLTGLRLSPSETRLKVGGEATLSVTYEPAGATQREVTWSTSDAAIVTVDEHGKVKAIAAGEATITVASKTNASIQATCKVIVEPATTVEDAIFANVLVAPNPFDNQLRIVNGDLRGTYALLNAQGVVVRSGNMTDNEVLIETSDLTSGLYLLRLTAANGAVKTITVVKER